MVSRDKGVLFGEAFAAMGTAVSSAPVIEDNRLPESGNILDKLPAVIVDIWGVSTAVRAGMRSYGHFNVNYG